MKRIAVILPLLLVALAPGVFARDDLPLRLPVDRYDALVSRSPFGLPARTGPAGPAFASDLYISEIAHMEGADWVTIRSQSDPAFRERVEIGTTNAHGYRIDGIEWR